MRKLSRPTRSPTPWILRLNHDRPVCSAICCARRYRQPGLLPHRLWRSRGLVGLGLSDQRPRALLLRAAAISFHVLPVRLGAAVARRRACICTFSALAILGLCIAAGCCYRVACVLFALGFTYVFLLDATNYQNHYYLIILLSWRTGDRARRIARFPSMRLWRRAIRTRHGARLGPVAAALSHRPAVLLWRRRQARCRLVRRRGRCGRCSLPRAAMPVIGPLASRRTRRSRFHLGRPAVRPLDRPAAAVEADPSGGLRPVRLVSRHELGPVLRFTSSRGS